MDKRKRTGTCSECTEPLYNPVQKTCCTAHRNKRARRIKRQAKERASQLPPGQHELSLAVNKSVKDVAHEVAKEELRPVVREAITEDVLLAIQKLVGLTPRMVDLIEADLSSTDDTVRQRAYTLLAKYTLGNSSVAPAPAEVAPTGLQVVFHLPRPGDGLTELEAEYEEVEPAEAQVCSECQQPKATFEGSSDRCTDCHAELMERVAHLRGDAPLP